MKPESQSAKEAMDGAKHAAAMDSVNRNFSQIIEQAALLARIRRAHFDASIKQGFTPEQALVLCMKPSLT